MSIVLPADILTSQMSMGQSADLPREKKYPGCYRKRVWPCNCLLVCFLCCMAE